MARRLHLLHAADHPLFVPAADFEAQYLKSVGGDLDAGGYHLAVAEVQAEIQGDGEAAPAGFADAYIWTFPYLDESRRGFLSSLYVEPGYRGQGVGRALVAHLHRWLEGEGVAHVELNVSSANAAAMQFWSRAGYEPYVQRLVFGLTAAQPAEIPRQ